MTQEGAFFYENLLAASRGDPCLSALEVQLFTDAYVIGEYNSPPYEFLNTVPSGERGNVQPAIVLRVAFHWHRQLVPAEKRKTESHRYHKGWLDDEAAALASLVLGTRIQCGPTTREFSPRYPKIGRPCFIERKKLISLPSTSNLQLALIGNPADLSNLSRLEAIERMTPAQSVSLVKAARLYQQALWLAEIDAADAWLLMVSAVETAASSWKSKKLSPVDELKSASPDLYSYLSTSASIEIIEGVAEFLRGKSGVKAKFIDFLIRFLPPAPLQRPPKAFQVEWDETMLRPIFAKVYDHRSRALHDGIGFPYPMTERGIKMDDEWEAPNERPGGLSTSTLDATWDSNDCPMLLHVFAYIVQYSILEWWSYETRAQ